LKKKTHLYVVDHHRKMWRQDKSKRNIGKYFKSVQIRPSSNHIVGVSFILTRLARIRQNLFVIYDDTVKHFLSFKRPKCCAYISYIYRFKGDVLELFIKEFITYKFITESTTKTFFLEAFFGQ